jgi:hypothetical protein
MGSGDDEGLDWIPQVVRTKLDRAGVRIHLVDWERLSLDERRELVEFPWESAEEVEAFRARLVELIPTLK